MVQRKAIVWKSILKANIEPSWGIFVACSESSTWFYKSKSHTSLTILSHSFSDLFSSWRTAFFCYSPRFSHSLLPISYTRSSKERQFLPLYSFVLLLLCRFMKKGINAKQQKIFDGRSGLGELVQKRLIPYCFITNRIFGRWLRINGKRSTGMVICSSPLPMLVRATFIARAYRDSLVSSL